MVDVLGYILEGIGHALLEMANWIPAPRWNSIGAIWARPIASCLAVGFIALIAALVLGHPWLYRLMLGAFVGAFGIICIAALCSKVDEAEVEARLKR